MSDSLRAIKSCVASFNLLKLLEFAGLNSKASLETTLRPNHGSSGLRKGLSGKLGWIGRGKTRRPASENSWTM